MQLDRIQRKAPKIPELVMQALVNVVESGQIQVGQELMPERVLAEILGTGRGLYESAWPFWSFSM